MLNGLRAVSLCENVNEMAFCTDIERILLTKTSNMKYDCL